MEKEYEVEFEVRYRVKVRCKPEDLSDTIADLNIPEDAETCYVQDSFDVFSVKDENGNEVDPDNGEGLEDFIFDDEE